MKFLRHVGTLKDTGHRVVVVFRKLPDEPESCLVVETDSLPDRFHQNLMEALESITAQETMEFYEYANRQFFFDGSNMLSTLHQRGFMRKIATNRVTMRPRIDLEINLSELNVGIDQVNNGIDPDAIQVGDNKVTDTNWGDKDVMSDSRLADTLRSQADMFEKQANELREQAASLDPKKQKKTRISKKSEVLS
jgi:hypothetical protein